MTAASNPDLLIAELAMGGLMAVFAYRFIAWVRDSPVTPDPWDVETDKKLSDPETRQVCPHCSTPQGNTAWFCPHCGSAVGPYNNMMPYLYIFSEGEVLRNSVNPHFRTRPLVMIGYMLVALGMTPIVTYVYLRVPVYWPCPILLLLLFNNLLGAENKKSD